MTISTLSSQTTVAGNGSTRAFSFSFIAGVAANVQVIYTNGNGNQTTLAPSQYTVSLNAPAAGQIWGVGGTVTYPLSGSPIAAGTTLTIQRILPLTQATSISNQSSFYPQAVEQALDTLCMEIQQVSARTGQLRGTWQTGAVYSIGDVVIDGTGGANTGNYYSCAVGNTSGTWSSDLASGYWSLALNIQAIQQSFTGMTGPNGAVGGNLASFNGTSGKIAQDSGVAAASVVQGPTSAGSGNLVSYSGTGGKLVQDSGIAAANVVTIQTASGQSIGFVNKFRNGTMDTAQRGASGTIATGVAAYTLDGWIVKPTGATVSWAQSSTGTTLTRFGLLLIGNTSMTDTNIQQRIESSCAAPFLNQQVTVQFNIYNSTGATITPTLSVAYANVTDNFGATTNIISVPLQACPNAAQTIVAYTFAAGTNVAKGLAVTLDFGAALNSNTKSVAVSAADIRVTAGVTTGLNGAPPSPELRPIGMELPFNQRYFQKSQAQSTIPGTAWTAGQGSVLFGTAAANGMQGASFKFPVVMRAAPTFITYDATGATGVISYWISSWSNGGSLSISNVSDSGWSGETGCEFANFEYAATAEL